MKLKNTIFAQGADGEVPFFVALRSLRETKDITVAYPVMKLLKQLQEKYEIYEEARRKLVEQFGKEDKKNKGSFSVGKKNTAAFMEEFKKLADTEEEYDGNKIILNKDVEINANDLLALEDVVEVKI